MNVNKVIKILRCDSSLQLDQLVKLISPDKNIHWFSECAKLLHVPIIFAGMKEVVMERKPLEILTVVKPLHITVILQGMKEFIMERTSMKAFSMVKPFYITAVSKCIK